MDPDLLDLILDSSNAALHWLKDIGLKFQLDLKLKVDGKYHSSPGTRCTRRGGGLGQLEHLRDWHWPRASRSATTPGLALHGTSHKIEGVGVDDPSGRIRRPCAGRRPLRRRVQAGPEMRAGTPRRTPTS